MAKVILSLVVFMWGCGTAKPVEAPMDGACHTTVMMLAPGRVYTQEQLCRPDQEVVVLQSGMVGCVCRRVREGVDL